MKPAPPQVDVWIDGEPAGDDPRVSAFDRGLLYGDSVFETLRTYTGRPFALREHLERLEESARRVGIPWTRALDGLEAEVRAAVREAAFDEAYVRIMVTRGDGPLGLVPTEDLRPRRIVFVGPLIHPGAELYERGASAITFQAEPRFGLQRLAGAKMGNYVPGILALQSARAAHADEALFIDGSGRLSEGATSNLFAVFGERLSTPGVEEGILPGVTRAVILALAEEMDLRVAFERSTLEEVLASDEVFVTSTIREVCPIVRIDGHAIQSGGPGPVTGRLLEAFRRHAREASIREG